MLEIYQGGEMDLEQRNECIRMQHKIQMDILSRKGADYTGGIKSKDANYNFQEIARRLEGASMNKWTSWAIYFEKQIMAVETFIKTGHLESEGIESRLHDIANYANIALSMLNETTSRSPE